jgi:hypothetical protein
MREPKLALQSVDEIDGTGTKVFCLIAIAEAIAGVRGALDDELSG